MPIGDRPARIAEVTGRGHPTRQLSAQRSADDRVEFVVAEFRELVEGPRAGVAAQVHVGIDEAGEQGGAGQIRDRAVGRGREILGLDSDDATGVHEQEDAARQEPRAVEGARCPVPVYVDQR